MIKLKILRFPGNVNGHTIFFPLIPRKWATRQGAWLLAERLGFDPGCRRGADFPSVFASRLVLGSIQPPIKLVPGSSPGVKAAEHRINLPTSS